jgi:hypothetical protein
MKTYVYLFLFQFGVPCSRPTTSSVCDEPLTDDDGESLVETPLSTGKVTLLNVLNEVNTPQIFFAFFLIFKFQIWKMIEHQPLGKRLEDQLGKSHKFTLIKKLTVT